jgi:Flp pilus assembly CpaF family ATPase
MSMELALNRLFCGDDVWQRIIERIRCHLSEANSEEIIFNGFRTSVLVTSGFVKSIQEEFFRSAEEMENFVLELALSCRVRLDPISPSAGGTIPDTCLRWHAVVPPVAQHGIQLTIRRHRFSALPMSSFAEGSLLKEISSLMVQRAPLVIAGDTGVGKTSLLMGLLYEFCLPERVIFIESLAEVQQLSPSWVHFVSQHNDCDGRGEVAIERVYGECLRMRPDRIVISEIRSNEARAFLLALLSGHRGLMTTIHGRRPAQILHRLSILSPTKIGQSDWLTIFRELAVKFVFMEERKIVTITGI